jgi:copper chaperone CopZ
MNYKAQLQGLHCEACKKITQKRLGKLEGVTLVNVDIDAQTALIESANVINQNQVEEILKDTEYKVTAFMEVDYAKVS